jgi:uncharacterized membrane protein YphA (DoxX/SURF4 family)
VAGRHLPGWVDAILGLPGIGVLARVALASAYILGGLTKLTDFRGAIAEQAHFGLHPAALWAGVTIAVELGGSILLITGRWLWLGAGALGVMTAVATLVANNFWTMAGHDRFMAINGFFEHIGLIGGFVLAALLARAGEVRGAAPTRLTLH